MAEKQHLFFTAAITKGHHRSNFDIQDEQSLPNAFEIYKGIAQVVNKLPN